MKNQTLKLFVIATITHSSLGHADITCSDKKATLVAKNGQNISFSDGVGFTVNNLRSKSVGKPEKDGGASVSFELEQYVIDLHKSNGLKLSKLAFPYFLEYMRSGNEIVFLGVYVISGDESRSHSKSDKLNVGVSYSTDAGKTYKTLYMKNCTPVD